MCISIHIYIYVHIEYGLQEVMGLGAPSSLRLWIHCGYVDNSCVCFDITWAIPIRICKRDCIRTAADFNSNHAFCHCHGFQIRVPQQCLLLRKTFLNLNRMP